jgi:putative hydrolase of the HAD superfamily
VAVPADLIAGVELLCLDAGNTVIFLDHVRLAALVSDVAGRPIAPELLVRTEGEAKRLAETEGLHDCVWSSRGRPGAASWGRMVATIAVRAGLPEERVPALLDRAWPEHEAKNLWCKVPSGLGASLDALRTTGVKVAIISNSEGMLDRLFADLGIASHFDLVVDSGKFGVEKPDRRIYEVAFEHFGIGPDRAVHLGDIFATDILGARAAGCRHALIDPFDHYDGLHTDVVRVGGVVPVADALSATRHARSRL